jgi:hypothetical protein
MTQVGSAAAVFNICRWQHDCNQNSRIGRYDTVLEIRLILPEAGQEETRMDANYVFLCGVMWCRFGQEDAGEELLRATESVDPDVSALAWAMLTNSAHRWKEFGKTGEPCSRTILGEELCG